MAEVLEKHSTEYSINNIIIKYWDSSTIDVEFLLVQDGGCRTITT